MEWKCNDACAEASADGSCRSGRLGSWPLKGVKTWSEAKDRCRARCSSVVSECRLGAATAHYPDLLGLTPGAHWEAIHIKCGREACSKSPIASLALAVQVPRLRAMPLRFVLCAMGGLQLVLQVRPHAAHARHQRLSHARGHSGAAGSASGASGQVTARRGWVIYLRRWFHIVTLTLAPILTLTPALSLTL